VTKNNTAARQVAPAIATKEKNMPTKVTERALKELTFVHTCPDGKHELRWQEGTIHTNYTIFLGDTTFKHGPYCHWCGEYLEGAQVEQDKEA